MKRCAALVALAALVCLGAGPPTRVGGSLSFPVSFQTEDGFTLKGDLTSAGSTESPVAILLHMYGHDRQTWKPLVPKLVAAGITVLAIDQRTHGESIHQHTDHGDVTRRVGEIPRDRFAAVVRNGPKDVAAARDYLEQHGFDVGHIALVGASYGCTVALLSANLEGVKALVLLSPGTAYFGVDVSGIARQSSLPLLAVAAEDDPEAARSARALSEGRSATSQLQIYPAGGHGTRLFAAHPELAARIAAFLRQSFGMGPKD